MKELTIEQKAKAYDEALEKAKKLYEKGTITESIGYIFPELKESEDERIRNSIIENLKGNMYRADGDYDLLNKQIAWLEKQGEKPQGKSEIERVRRAIEAIKEKPVDNANKVEPIFEIEKNKWYICIKDLLDNYGDIAFYKGDIYLSTRDGTLIPCNSNVPFDVEVCSDMYFKEWTIEDAKDGDVLYSLDSNQPFIYKERNIHEQATAYCGINKYGKFFVWNTKDCIITLDKYIPATKEQRDTLMNAMTKAGWQFNFDKKELKKIESNPAWSEEDEQRIKKVMHIISCDGRISNEECKSIFSWLESLKERIGG